MKRRTLLASLPSLFLFPTAVAEAATAGPAKRYDVAWEATVPDGSHGYGIVLRQPRSAAVPADWVYPNVPGALAIGFCTYDPPTENPFNADRNINGNPQQEVSLHWNGVEMARRLSPVPLLGTHPVKASVQFVVGGAEVSVRVGAAAPVFERFFIAGVSPYAPEAVSGGGAALRRLALSGSATLAPSLPPPIRVRAFDKQINDAKHHVSTAQVAFPANPDPYGRVVCTLTLAATPDGLDPWDRIAALYLYDEKGERFEILRYMTPYRKAYIWTADVTDLLPLLTGTKKVELNCETYAAGWLVTVDFDFYPGPLSPRPYKVENLWSTVAVIGQADKPVEKAIPPKTLVIDPAAKRVAVRTVVTGHGQAPNTDNAAEFLPLWRKLTVNGHAHQNTLWKTDNYLNPCRPQGGTWKYDRAGWGPGTVVDPWLVDVTKDVAGKSEATFVYEIQPYENKTPVGGNPARHIVEAQVVSYK